MQSMLFGLKPWDVFVYASASVALWAVAIAGALSPRAARDVGGPGDCVALRV